MATFLAIELPDRQIEAGSGKFQASSPPSSLPEWIAVLLGRGKCRPGETLPEPPTSNTGR